MAILSFLFCAAILKALPGESLLTCEGRVGIQKFVNTMSNLRVERFSKTLWSHWLLIKTLYLEIAGRTASILGPP
jgi:hypothetical protein